MELCRKEVDFRITVAARLDMKLVVPFKNFGVGKHLKEANQSFISSDH